MNRLIKMFIILFVFSFLACYLTAFAEKDDAKFKLIIGQVKDQLQGHYAEIPVYLVGDISAIEEINVLIGYPTYPLELVRIFPNNPILDSIESSPDHYVYDIGMLYDYYDSLGLNFYDEFSYKTDSNDSVTTVGISAIFNNKMNDKLKSKNSVNLFTLQFLVTNDRTYECENIPVQFVWSICDDNKIKYSRTVLDIKSEYTARLKELYFPYEHVRSIRPYFSHEESKKRSKINPYNKYNMIDIKGAEKCMNTYNYSDQLISFYNGEVEVICCGIDPRGDVNLNGFSYEPEDIIVFKDYLLKGESAFTVHIEGQFASTDVNADGQLGSLRDFQYLIANCMGDALLYSKIGDPSNGQMMLTAEDNQININYKFDKPIGSVLFKFNSPDSIDAIEMLDNFADYKYDYSHNHDTLSVIVYSIDLESFDTKVLANTGRFIKIKYSGKTPELILAEAAGYYGEEIDLRIIKREP